MGVLLKLFLVIIGVSLFWYGIKTLFCSFFVHGYSSAVSTMNKEIVVENMLASRRRTKNFESSQLSPELTYTTGDCWKDSMYDKCLPLGSYLDRGSFPLEVSKFVPTHLP